MSRQQIRQYRLLELEREQHMEDADGLVMTEEQRQALFDSFESVKLEFHDLDGLRWTQTALRRRKHTHRPTILPKPSSRRPFAMVADPQIPAYDLDATVRDANQSRGRPRIDISWWVYPIVSNLGASPMIEQLLEPRGPPSPLNLANDRLLSPSFTSPILQAQVYLQA
ncbi:hypothetical protein NP233_g8771 [Leucocoprinus birnbaumii]|uniref:Uncharacterized protein n=1 Tax=Leucocoprinus birnbaumii TaxID=56174 RepID=A0AAD5VMB1_9AGAR|nr:hypothetical protein NP233_g8771 [Leucocoprinus birnbaumii]